jgi:hypothetical protein
MSGIVKRQGGCAKALFERKAENFDYVQNRTALIAFTQLLSVRTNFSNQAK